MGSPELSSLVAALASSGPAAPVRFRVGVVQTVAADGTATVTVGGSSTAITGVKVASSCCPVPGATCWLAVDGRDLFVLATLAPYGPAFGSMRQSSAQTVGTGAFTALDWTNRTDTTASGVTLGATGITCVVPGVYQVSVAASFAANTTGVRHLQIIKNGTTVDFAVYSTNAPSGTEVCRMTGTVPIRLAVGDYVNGSVFQSSGGNLSTNVAAGHTTIRAVWLGP